MDAAGIEPVTSRWKTITYAIYPHGLVDILRVSFFHLDELATSEFWLNLCHSRRPKETFVKYTSLVYEPGATKLLFSLNSGPKKALSLSVDVKCDQQTHKMMPPIMAWISRKSSNKVPITIFQILLAGRQTHKNRHFYSILYGFEGDFIFLCMNASFFSLMVWFSVMMSGIFRKS